MISADEALERLKQGNRRFVAREAAFGSKPVRPPGEEGAAPQAPFAIVLGCSDSRAPVEHVFDQGLGDLFVVRVAGSIATPPLIGSVEFAVAKFETPLVVVLGHTGCGAVMATLDELRQPSAELSPNLRAIVEAIRPAVAGLVEPATPGGSQPEEVTVREAGRANVRATVARLARDSELLAGAIRTGGLRVLGAEYALETGQVAFFDDAS